MEVAAGPPLRVVSTSPVDGAGFDCPISDLECGVPIDATFEIRFDRFLLPSTAVRQSFLLYSGTEGNSVPMSVVSPALTPRYDLIERVVSYDLPSGVLLEPNTHYTFELIVPVSEDDFGFRAFDGAGLDPDATVRLSFLTSNQRKPATPPDSSVDCYTMTRTLNDHCDSAGCHDASERTMGLDLSNANGLVRTAVGRVAHQAETGPKTGVPLQNPARFGVAMPRIDPGRPDNSYLMYKLLLAPENYWPSPTDPDTCGTRHEAAVDPEACVLASPEERARLQDWFLRGLGMPQAVGDDPPSFLVRRELLGIDAWIRAGAVCP